MKLIFPERFPQCYSLGGGLWRLTEPWTFSVDGFEVTVPAGFETDLYSAPWIVTLAIPRDEEDNRPGLAHDALYGTVGARPNANGASRFDRATCDAVLLEGMRMCGFSLWRRTVIYTGVKLGGWVPWNRLAKKGYSLANPCLGRG